MVNIASWNVWGLNDHIRQLDLKRFLLRNKISLVGVLETRAESNKQASILAKCCYGFSYEDNYQYARNRRI